MAGRPPSSQQGVRCLSEDPEGAGTAGGRAHRLRQQRGEINQDGREATQIHGGLRQLVPSGSPDSQADGLRAAGIGQSA